MILEVDIQKKFRNFSCDFTFTLECDKCGIFGPSGNGKTTLMHMLAGLLQPDHGHITLNGTTLFHKKKGINLPPETRNIGVVFQHVRLFPHMKVKKNLFYGMKRTKKKDRTIDRELLIEILQLRELLNRSVSKLSGGERQRVALGRTILACPKLILLDEPLTGLDSKLKYSIIPQLRRVFDQFSIPMLFISHNLQEMRMMTDETLVLKDGKVENQFSTETLARTTLGSGGKGYINLLNLHSPKNTGRLRCYKWEKNTLMLTKTENEAPGQFALNSRDILLFKKNPEATSARNMLSCTVKRIYQTDWLSGIELECNGSTLIAEIVPQSLEELDIKPGSELVTVFKASAIERIW